MDFTGAIKPAPVVLNQLIFDALQPNWSQYGSIYSRIGVPQQGPVMWSVFVLVHVSSDYSAQALSPSGASRLKRSLIC